MCITGRISIDPIAASGIFSASLIASLRSRASMSTKPAGSRHRTGRIARFPEQTVNNVSARDVVNSDQEDTSIDGSGGTWIAFPSGAGRIRARGKGRTRLLL